jgi:hypothetical protein
MQQRCLRLAAVSAPAAHAQTAAAAVAVDLSEEAPGAGAAAPYYVVYLSVWLAANSLAAGGCGLRRLWALGQAVAEYL